MAGAEKEGDLGLVLVDFAVGVVGLKIIVGHNVCSGGYVIAPKTGLQFYIVYGVIHPRWHFRLRELRNEPIVQRNAILTVTLLKSIKGKDRRAYLGSLSTVSG